MAPPLRPTTVIRLVLVALALAALAGLLHSAPFYGPSYAAWVGIGLALLGLVSVVFPLRIVGIPHRRAALVVLSAGVLLVIGAAEWPVPSLRSTRPHHRLDDYMPSYQFAEYHEVRTRAPLGAVVEATRAVSLADMPVAVLLLAVRGLADGRLEHTAVPRRPILDLMTQPGSGFLPLDFSNPGELVLGMAGGARADGNVTRVMRPPDFRGLRGPGQVAVAFDVRAVPLPDGTVRVSTETRCFGQEDATRRVFARYWRIIYPGSAIIRQVWLEAIVARAEKRAGGIAAAGR